MLQAIQTEESPNLYKQDENIDGQTPQFQLVATKPLKPLKQGPSILDELSIAMNKYQEDSFFKELREETEEHRIKPYFERQEDRSRPMTPVQEEWSNGHRDSDIPIVSSLFRDNDFLKHLDNDIKKTEESLKEMNDRFTRIKQQQ